MADKQHMSETWENKSYLLLTLLNDKEEEPNQLDTKELFMYTVSKCLKISILFEDSKWNLTSHEANRSRKRGNKDSGISLDRGTTKNPASVSFRQHADIVRLFRISEVRIFHTGSES